MHDMHITVGHIVDNPTFSFDGKFEITSTEDDGTVFTLFDSDMMYNGENVPVELLVEPVTYMVVNSATGTLRLEVG